MALSPHRLVTGVSHWQVSSSASAELQGCRNTAPPQVPQPPPGPCAPPAPPVAPGLGAGPLSETVDARQALLDAIRSGSGAARLKKVSEQQGHRA